MKNKICIVVADYYPVISKMLIKGVFSYIENNNLADDKIRDNIEVIYVPGIFEIPVTIAKLMYKYDAFIALGCVIKGKTPHFNIISKSVVKGIMNLSVQNKKPIGNGIITCLNKKQAIERASPNKKNKGAEAARAVFITLSNF